MTPIFDDDEDDQQKLEKANNLSKVKYEILGILRRKTTTTAMAMAMYTNEINVLNATEYSGLLSASALRFCFLSYIKQSNLELH